MRVAIIESGVVTSVVLLDATMVIDADGKAARGPASYTVEGGGGSQTVTYEAVYSAPSGGILVASEAAGVGWTYLDGSFVGPAVSSEPAPPKRQFTFLEFMALFTSAEQAAIVNSADTNVKLFLLMAAGASFIDLDDARTATGVTGLVTLGLITQDRHDAIMAGQAPV